MNVILSKLFPRRAAFEAAFKSKADQLESQNGAEACTVAYGAMRRIDSTREDFKLLRLIKKRLGIKRRADTATRYLVGNPQDIS